MKKAGAIILALGVCVLFGSCGGQKEAGCLTGAFFADRPTGASIEKFAVDYGKRPALILIFLDWGKFPDESMVHDVYSAGSALMVTWEPWQAERKKPIDYDALLAGKDDDYIREFALKLKAIGKPVFLRLAHEMNGDWYPWAGTKIGPEKYQGFFRHVRRVFDGVRAGNVRWVFAVNAENVPQSNTHGLCYPGDRFVDYIGLDGYNWGDTQNWSRWRSFSEIFSGVYQDVLKRYRKPVIISEFGSTSSGGDKARWITDALQEVKKMPAVRGIIFFNMNKETDWKFLPDSASGQKLKDGLKDPYFMETPRGDR